MEFRKCTLGDLSLNGRGEYGIAASAVEYNPEKKVYLRITDICDDGTLDNSDRKSVEGDNLDRYILKPNDIVFARTGASTGRNYFYDGTDGEMVFAGFLIKFSIDERVVNPKFIKYYCLSKKYKAWIQSFATGSTRGNINAQTLASMPIDLPPRDYQNRMVEILDLIDLKIKENKAINHNLQQQAFALFDSLFANVSDGSRTIGDYITPKRGRNLLSKDAVQGTVPVVAGGLEPATYHNAANTTAPVLTISASGANAGFVNLWHKPVWSSDSSFIDSSMTKDVYFWFVMLKKRQREIFDAQTGSAQPHIYPQHIAAMPVCDLDESVISLFSAQVTPLFALIGANRDENERLSAIRDTLLPRLMSGEIDISEVEL